MKITADLFWGAWIASFLAVAAAGSCGPRPAFAAEVTGFRLWDAAADRPISTAIAPGGTLTISDAQKSCVSVEIVTDGPGSLRKTLDGVLGPKENSYPYAWEDDGGSPAAFDCAPSLNSPGRRTLVVEPFSGPDWTGTPGAPASVVLVTEEPPPVCQPTTRVGLECGESGARWEVEVPPDAAGRSDPSRKDYLYWGVVAGPGTTTYGPSSLPVWQTDPAREWNYAQAWACVPLVLWRAALADGSIPPGTPQCTTSAPRLYGYLDGVPLSLPEPGVAGSLRAVALVAAIVIGSRALARRLILGRWRP